MLIHITRQGFAGIAGSQRGISVDSVTPTVQTTMSDEMIDINKQYKTRCGYNARVYAIEENEIHAAYQYPNGEWLLLKYGIDGRREFKYDSPSDLIEVVSGC